MLNEDDAAFRLNSLARLERMLEEIKSMDLFLWEGVFPCFRVTVRKSDGKGDALVFVVGIEVAQGEGEL